MQENLRALAVRAGAGRPRFLRLNDSESFLLAIEFIEPLSKQFSLAQAEAGNLFHHTLESLGVHGYLRTGFEVLLYASLSENSTFNGDIAIK